jgi:hypothetical protein
MSDEVWFAILYTSLVAAISFFYNWVGYREGIHDTIQALREHEPKAIDRAIMKLRGNDD